MSSIKKCNVYLPNGKRLEIKLQSKHTGKDLVDIVCSYLGLKEKDYFRIMYNVDGVFEGWVCNDKLMIQQDFNKKANQVDFRFAVKFFAESVELLNTCLAAELYFLHIRYIVYKGLLEVQEAHSVFQLAAHVLQVYFGNYSSDQKAIENLKTLAVLPKKIVRNFKESVCEEAIVLNYKKLVGKSKGVAVMEYLELAENLPTYGLHFFRVKDKQGKPCHLAISYKGISQYHINNKSKHFKTYYWRQLQNLFCKDKKFTIEVVQDESIINLQWHSSPHVIKSLFQMSIDQHHYYLRRGESKTKLIKDKKRLERKITENNKSLIETGVSKSNSESMTRIKDVDVTIKRVTKEDTPELRQAERDLINSLKNRRTLLEDRLYESVQQLKLICMKESEFTGILPNDYIKYLDLNEKVPKIKKKFNITTAYTGCDKIDISSYFHGVENNVSHLENQAELLNKICRASFKLAKESNRKKVRTSKTKLYGRYLNKLKNTESSLDEISEVNRTSFVPHDLHSNNSSCKLSEVSTLHSSEATPNKELDSPFTNVLIEDASVSSGIDVRSDIRSVNSIDVRSTSSNPSVIESRFKLNEKNTISDSSLSQNSKRSITPPPNQKEVLKLTKFVPATLFNKTLNNRPVRATHEVERRKWKNATMDAPKQQMKGWTEASLDNKNSPMQEHHENMLISRKNSKPAIYSTDESLSQLSVRSSSTNSSSIKIKTGPEVLFSQDNNSQSENRRYSFDPENAMQDKPARPNQLNLPNNYSSINHPPSPLIEVYNVPLASPKFSSMQQFANSPHGYVISQGGYSVQGYPAMQPSDHPIVNMQPNIYNGNFYKNQNANGYPSSNQSHENDDSDLESNLEWAPSLHDYSNRTSVAESGKKRREEILNVLGDHLKRVSIAESTKSSLYHGNNIQQNELQRRVRERIRDEINFSHARTQLPPNTQPFGDNTWRSYQQKYHQQSANNNTNKQQMKYVQPNIFQHSKPLQHQVIKKFSPPPSPMLYRTQKRVVNKQAAKTPAPHHYSQPQNGKSSNVVEVRKLRRSASAHDVIENEDQSSTTQHDKMKGGVFVQIRKSSSPKQSMYAAVTTKNPTSHPLGYHSLKKTSKKTSNLRDYQTQGGGTLPRNMGKKSRRPLFIDNIQKSPSLSRASHSFRETGSPKPSRMNIIPSTMASPYMTRRDYMPQQPPQVANQQQQAIYPIHNYNHRYTRHRSAENLLSGNEEHAGTLV